MYTRASGDVGNEGRRRVSLRTGLFLSFCSARRLAGDLLGDLLDEFPHRALTRRTEIAELEVVPSLTSGFDHHDLERSFNRLLTLHLLVLNPLASVTLDLNHLLSRHVLLLWDGFSTTDRS